MTARKVLDKAMLEVQLQTAVIQYAHLRGWLVHHDRPAASKRGKWATHIEGDPGFFDLVLIRDAHVVFAELKREVEKLTPNQEAWFRAAGELQGLCAYVWRPSDWSSGLIQKVLA